MAPMSSFRKACLMIASTWLFGDMNTTAELNLRKSRGNHTLSRNPDRPSQLPYPTERLFQSKSIPRDSLVEYHTKQPSGNRKVAFLEIQGQEFQMTPIPLRTVRPFVMEEIVLSEVAEEENLSLSDKMEINKYLRSRVSSMRHPPCEPSHNSHSRR